MKSENKVKDIPEWMKETKVYVPEKDRDGFLTRSILKLMGVLRRIRAVPFYDKGDGSAAVTLLFTIITISLVSASKNMFFTYVILAGTLVRICVLPEKALKRVCQGSFVAALFTALILMPAALLGSAHTLPVVTCKVFVSVSLINIMAVTTPFNKITEGLRFFHVPDLFIFTLDITLKYIVMLGELSVNMLEAVKLRSVGKNRTKSKAFSGVLGCTFLKANEMAKEVYGAMECRGFTGEYERKKKIIFKKEDIIIIAMIVAICFMYRYLENAMVVR